MRRVPPTTTVHRPGPRRLLVTAAAAALVAATAACTTQVDGTATATPPTLVDSKEIGARIPDATFFGSEATKDDTYDSGLGFYCKDQLFADPGKAGAGDPIEQSVQQKSGTNDLGVDLQQIAMIIGVFDSVKAAKDFNTSVATAISKCPPNEQIDFGGSVQNLTYVERPYKHGGWTGTALLSKVSIAIKSSGAIKPGVQLSVAASRLNVQVQFNIYGVDPPDSDAALASAQSRADQFLDTLAAGK